MSERMTDNDLEQQAKRALDQSEQQVPDSVRAALAEARSKALAQAAPRPKSNWLTPSLAAAASTVLALGIWFATQGPTVNAPLDSMELMVSLAELDETEWELVDDLEFAIWLSEQESLDQSAELSYADNQYLAGGRT